MQKSTSLIVGALGGLALLATAVAVGERTGNAEDYDARVSGCWLAYDLSFAWIMRNWSTTSAFRCAN